ncbi:MAG: baseplate J/gp47 family protein [Oscillospiraceae bacterium]|nr:baseplate J/gp47 family protein [Oscillospiraceae bacterium]
MTVNEITEYLLSEISDNYDVSVGSFFYDILYPVAEKIYLIQEDIAELAENSFALTAKGEYLDRKAAEQGLERKEAECAKGVVRITGSRGEIVPKNAKMAADNILFKTEESAVIPESEYVDLSAVCMTPGTGGNVKAGAINRFPVTLPGLTEVMNIEAFTGGYDEETDAELLERYLEKVSRPNASGNKYHYIGWAKEVAGVGGVNVIPLHAGAGTVKVIITDSENKPAGDELISKVKEHIEENRPIGADVTVVSASALNIDISVALAADADVRSDIEDAIRRYFANTALKKSYISYAKIGGIILSIDGVDDYSDLKINGRTENISISDGSVPVLGSVTIL